MADLKFSNSTYQNGTADSQTPLVDGVDQKTAEHINYPVSAILQLETVLGSATGLVGAKADLNTRLNVSLNTDGTIKTGGTTNGVLYNQSSTALTSTAQGAANSVLTANAGAPVFSQTPQINTSLIIGVAGAQTGTLILDNGSNSNTLTLRAGATGSNLTFTLPTADGSSGQAVVTDGSGNLSLATVAFDPESNSVWYEDFLDAHVATQDVGLANTMWVGVLDTMLQNQGTNGILVVPATNPINIYPADMDSMLPYAASKSPVLKMRMTSTGAASAGNRRVGFTSAPTLSGGDPANGIYLRWLNSTGAISLVCRASATETTLASGFNAGDGVYRKWRISVTSSLVSLVIDGAAIGTISTNIPSANMLWAFGMADTLGGGINLDYVYVSQTR